MPMRVFERAFNWGSQLALPMRITGSLLFIAILFAATIYNEEIYIILGDFWQKLFSPIVSSQPIITSSQSGGIIGQLARRPRNIVAIASYSLIYISVCISLLYLLLPHPSQRKLILICYGFSSGLVCLLLVGSVLGGKLLIVLNDQLIHSIVSPLPVIILAPLLWWYTYTKDKTSSRQINS